MIKLKQVNENGDKVAQFSYYEPKTFGNIGVITVYANFRFGLLIHSININEDIELVLCNKNEDYTLTLEVKDRYDKYFIEESKRSITIYLLELKEG